MGQGNIVVFSFGTFLGKVFSKDGIPMANVFGCIVKRILQVARTSFFHVSIAVCEKLAIKTSVIRLNIAPALLECYTKITIIFWRFYYAQN